MERAEQLAAEMRQRIANTLDKHSHVLSTLATKMDYVADAARKNETLREEHDERIRSLENSRLTLSTQISTLQKIGAGIVAVLTALGAEVSGLFRVH